MICKKKLRRNVIKTNSIFCRVPCDSTARFVHSSFHPSIHPSVHPFIFPSIHPSIHPSVHPSVHLSFCSSVRPSVHPSVGVFICWSVRLSVRPSIHPSIRRSVHLSVCSSVGMSITLDFFGLWPHYSCPNDQVTSNAVPIHPHTTEVAVYSKNSIPYV